MKEIIPAIMPNSFTDLNEKLERYISLVPFVQIDVMDGKFVPAKSWPLIKPEDKDFLSIINQEVGFPFWEELNIEADLMVIDPGTHANTWAAAGASRIVIHYTSAPEEKIIEVLSELKDKGIETGIAFSSKTPIEGVIDFISNNIDSIDYVQLMGIERIGFQGQPFDEQVIDRVITVKEHFPDLVISVDGSVNQQTAQALVDAGVTRLVSGSALSEADSLEDAILDFKDILGE